MSFAACGVYLNTDAAGLDRFSAADAATVAIVVTADHPESGPFAVLAAGRGVGFGRFSTPVPAALCYRIVGVQALRVDDPETNEH